MQCHLRTFTFLYLLRSFSLFPSLENISIFTNRKRDIWNMTWHESPMTIFFKISADVSSVSVTNVWLTLHAAHIPRQPPATSSSYLNLARRVPGLGGGGAGGGPGAGRTTITQVTKIDGKWADTVCPRRHQLPSRRSPPCTSQYRLTTCIPNNLTPLFLHVSHITFSIIHHFMTPQEPYQNLDTI